MMKIFIASDHKQELYIPSRQNLMNFVVIVKVYPGSYELYVSSIIEHPKFTNSDRVILTFAQPKNYR